MLVYVESLAQFLAYIPTKCILATIVSYSLPIYSYNHIH